MNPSDDLSSPSPARPKEPSLGPTPAAQVPLTQGALDGTLERFAREFIQDRRRDRRWRVFFRLMWLGLFAVFMALSMSSRQQTTVPNGRHTAVVELRGEIALATDASAEALVGALRKAFEDKGSQAVVLRINSPGGSPVQSGIVHDEIKRLKEKHNKKVYAVVEEMCASGAYYIAASADEIYADKASIVGSIGVLMNGFGFTGLMDKLGVERRLMTAGENKGMNDPFSPVSEKQRAFTQNMLDKVHEQFIKVVKEGRGARLNETPEMFSGLYWTGEQAKELGLVDGLLNLDQVAREVVKAEELIDYTPKDNVAERLAKRFGASIGEGAMRALQSMGGLR